ncbi:MAG: lamin tail domain-containing protein [Saprospiraceae bacterium]
MKKTTLTFLACLSLLMAAQAQIVITEIMYNPPEAGTDSLEYIELYNNTGTAVNVSNWTFSQGFAFTFPAGSSIGAGQYVTIAKSASAFQAAFGSAPTYVWDMGGALTNSPGEDIALHDGNGSQIDSVDYKNAAPWPTEAAGNGPSIVLCDPNSDNNVGTNWQAATTPTGVFVGGKEVKGNPGAAASCGGAPTFPERTIAEVTTVNPTTGVADSVGIDLTITGTVYGVNLRGTTGLQFTLIDDANNGIAVFSQTDNLGYTVQEGDEITMSGFIGQFNGLIQMLPNALTKLSTGNPLVSPATVTKPDESTESSLIRILNLHLVDPSAWDTTGNAAGFTVRAVSSSNPNDTIDIRIDNNTNLYLSPVPPQPFNLTGIGGQFDSSNPYTSGYQVSPRYKDDISTLVATHEADFSASVRLSPNPASDYLTVQSELSFDRVRILSATGTLLRTLDRSDLQNRIDLGTLPTGTYFLRFEKDGGLWTTRFVKL